MLHVLQEGFLAFRLSTLCQDLNPFLELPLCLFKSLLFCLYYTEMSLIVYLLLALNYNARGSLKTVLPQPGPR